MKWFSFSGIITEVRRIRWPSWKELWEKSSKVIGFTVLFAVFFVLCTLLISWLLGLMGIVGL